MNGYNKLSKALSTLAIQICCFAIFTSNASAANLDCAAKSQGLKVRWNHFWEADKSDNDIIYIVKSVTEIDRIPLREITMELKSDGPASQSSRRLVISTEEKARAFCERIVKERRILKFPEYGAAEDLESLPFIRITKEGWYRADRPRDAELTVCRVGQTKFSCPASDLDRFGNSLKTLEEELRSLPQ